MSFIEKLNETLGEEFNVSVTENGAVGYRTTGKELLDLNFSVSSLRSKHDREIRDKFAKAYFENKLLAVKWLFFASDVRGGMGERRLFRVCINWLAEENPDVVRRVLPLIPEYNRWDNILNLLDTDINNDVINIIKNQLEADMDNMKNGKSISLIAKWLPSANASSNQTKENARKVIKGIGITERQYRKMLSALRKYLDVVEVKMSAKEWGAIDYSAVPSRANLIYNGAFLRNDEERRRSFLKSLTKGEAKINAGTLFPHDIVHKYTHGYGRSISRTDTAIEELWKALPDYVKGADNTICVADGSGSMMSRIGVGTSVSCLDVANALAIYFAERSSGEFKDKFITFSENPKLVDIGTGNSLRDKICIALRHSEIANTNIEAVFDLILRTAIEHNMSQEDIPHNILILSDMEFDSCTTTTHYHGDRLGWGREGIQKKLFTVFAKKYESYGYKLPRLVFWNINSRTGTIPVRENELGVALVSGYSPAIMKMVLSNETDPFKCLVEQLNAERYDAVENAIKDLL